MSRKWQPPTHTLALQSARQKGSTIDFTALKAVILAATGTAAGRTYHLGWRSSRRNEDFVTFDQMGPLAVLKTTAIEGVKARVVCHHPGAP